MGDREEVIRIRGKLIKVFSCHWVWDYQRCYELGTGVTSQAIEHNFTSRDAISALGIVATRHIYLIVLVFWVVVVYIPGGMLRIYWGRRSEPTPLPHNSAHYELVEKYLGAEEQEKTLLSILLWTLCPQIFVAKGSYSLCFKNNPNEINSDLDSDAYHNREGDSWLRLLGSSPEAAEGRALS